MPAPPVVDQEFVVHLFAPLDGPQVPRAYGQVQRIWAACRRQLGMTGQIPGQPGATLPSLKAIGKSAPDSVLATQEQPGVRQAVLRRTHDALNLSLAFAQPAPEGRRAARWGRLNAVRPPAVPPHRRLGWADYAALWARASQPEPGALLAEARLFLARTPPKKTGSVAATAELGEVVDALLPYREDRPEGWWRWGTTTTAGYALWDTGLAADTSAIREIVLIAGADRDVELSTWAWSDRTPAMPPFARYLMHAAKLRYEARLVDSWHAAMSAGQDLDALAAELNAGLGLGSPAPGDAGLLSSLRGRLRAEETRLTLLQGEMKRLEQTVSVAQQNLAQPGCEASDGSAGMFAADKSLASFLSGQVTTDRNYLQIELDGIRHLRERVTEELNQLTSRSPEPEPTASRDGDASQETRRDASRQVFVVYGRDGALRKSFFDLLYLVGLEPLEWERLVPSTGTTIPYLGDVVQKAPHLAQATLVLLSPDDIVELHPDLFQENDQPYERARSGQARPNVLFELGLAFMAYPERTIVVQVGKMRPISDLAGRNVIHFDGSAVAVAKVMERLRDAGCPVETSGRTDWLDTGRFAGLATYSRGPGTGEAPGDGGS
jgi:predicted nucleotide-binding protein